MEPTAEVSSSLSHGNAAPTPTAVTTMNQHGLIAVQVVLQQTGSCGCRWNETTGTTTDEFSWSSQYRWIVTVEEAPAATHRAMTEAMDDHDGSSNDPVLRLSKTLVLQWSMEARTHAEHGDIMESILDEGNVPSSVVRRSANVSCLFVIPLDSYENDAHPTGGSHVSSLRHMPSSVARTYVVSLWMAGPNDDDYEDGSSWDTFMDRHQLVRRRLATLPRMAHPQQTMNPVAKVTLKHAFPMEHKCEQPMLEHHDLGGEKKDGEGRSVIGQCCWLVIIILAASFHGRPTLRIELTKALQVESIRLLVPMDQQCETQNEHDLDGHAEAENVSFEREQNQSKMHLVAPQHHSSIQHDDEGSSDVKHQEVEKKQKVDVASNEDSEKLPADEHPVAKSKVDIDDENSLQHSTEQYSMSVESQRKIAAVAGRENRTAKSVWPQEKGKEKCIEESCEAANSVFYDSLVGAQSLDTMQSEEGTKFIKQTALSETELAENLLMPSHLGLDGIINEKPVLPNEVFPSKASDGHNEYRQLQESSSDTFVQKKCAPSDSPLHLDKPCHSTKETAVLNHILRDSELRLTGVEGNMKRDENASHATNRVRKVPNMHEELSENVSDAEESYESTLPPDSDYQSEDDHFVLPANSNFDDTDGSEAHCEFSKVDIAGSKMEHTLEVNTDGSLVNHKKAGLSMPPENDGYAWGSSSAQVVLKDGESAVTPLQENKDGETPSGPRKKSRQEEVVLDLVQHSSPDILEVKMPAFLNKQREKKRPYQNSSIIADHVPSNKLQTSSHQFMHDKVPDMLGSSRSNPRKRVIPKMISLPARKKIRTQH
jgi:hypothetical protein